MQNSLETNQEMSVTEFYNSLFDQYWVFLNKKKDFSLWIPTGLPEIGKWRQ